MSFIILFMGWISSLVATMGSLFFSEVMHFPPCILCWYQRICMYPLVLLLGVGVLYQDRNIFRYSFPLAFSGWIISLYHNLLYFKIIPENLVPCSQGISCSAKFIEWAGFVTIPLLSFTGFTIIIYSLLMIRKKK